MLLLDAGVAPGAVSVPVWVIVSIVVPLIGMGAPILLIFLRAGRLIGALEALTQSVATLSSKLEEHDRVLGRHERDLARLDERSRVEREATGPHRLAIDDSGPNR